MEIAHVSIVHVIFVFIFSSFVAENQRNETNVWERERKGRRWQCARRKGDGSVVREMLAKDKAHDATAANEEFDLDELMDDPELEKLHAERIAALKKEAEKRQVLKRQGHGEYREISEGDFLGEVHWY
ncbi:Thioredoxin-like protein [Dioscorea alata]|uniref:Thioredoxin-like protein n=1 Tax=Dioscorea alata TaxID=55571 RepID=A0ACB7WMU9_DIOAL|nr:Thioredoxin-like protein [Dioscorea alata]